MVSVAYKHKTKPLSRLAKIISKHLFDAPIPRPFIFTDLDTVLEPKTLGWVMNIPCTYGSYYEAYGYVYVLCFDTKSQERGDIVCVYRKSDREKVGEIEKTLTGIKLSPGFKC